MNNTTQSSSNPGGATAAVLLLAVLWGMNWPAVRIALSDITPWTLRAAGLVTSGGLLLAVAMARGDSLRVARGQWWRVVVAGLTNIAGFNLLTTFAQLSGSTSRAAIITYTMPIWTVVLAWMFLGERPDRRRLFALAMGGIGLALLLVPVIHSHSLNAGAWFALGAGVSWAFGTVFLEKFPIDAAPLALAAWQLLIAASVAAGGALAFEHWPVLAAIGWAARWAFVYHAVFAIALGYFVWFGVAARLPAGLASLSTLLVPVVGVSGAMMLLHERPAFTDLAGFACIIVSAWTSLRGTTVSQQTRAAIDPRSKARVR